MDNYGVQIGRARKVLGWSQIELARAAGVSRATLQNMEAETANPSVSNLCSVLGVLGFQLAVERPRFNWDLLVDHGLPLGRGNSAAVKPTFHSLVRALQLAILELQSSAENGSPAPSRWQESFESLLLAIQNGFPTAFAKCVVQIPGLTRWLPREVTGRHIKLKRISERLVSAYL